MVAEWLATETWDDSFAVLREHQAALATTAGRDQIRAQSGHDHALAALHLGILDIVAGGVPLEAIQQIVTDIGTATAICVQGLADGQPQFAATILRVADALQHSPRGIAMHVAILTHLGPDDARTLCTRLATDEPDIAAAVADELESLSGQIAAAGTPLPDAASFIMFLRTRLT